MASSSDSLSRKTSTQILTIHQMVESLSNLRNQLSIALKNHTAKAESSGRPTGSPAQGDGGDQREEVAESSATAEARVEHCKKEREEGTEITGSIETHQDPHFEKLLSNIKYLTDALWKTKDLEEKLEKPIQSIQSSLEEIVKSIEEAPPGSSLEIGANYLDTISKDIKTLKFQIPSYHKLSLAGTSAHMMTRGSRTPAQSEFKLPNLYGDQVFDESPAFKEIQQVYNGFIDHTRRKCFLYFAVFPENVVLKKRFLTHWWIGEGLLDPSGTGDQTPEDIACRILQDFADKGLIVPVKEEQKKIKKRFRMPPLVRSAAIKLAQEDKFLDYDSGNNPTGKSSGCDRIFLVKGEVSHRPDPPTLTNPNLEETMESIFNVSQPFPDSALEWLAKKGDVDMRTVKVVEWFLKLRKLKVLYLGRWQSAVDEHHIEVESIEFLKGLKKMKKLRLLSLQGISWINVLPNSIKKLSDLRVLDLKSCHNLEKLPEGIGSLKKLTHLDISGCYMLDQMPKSISALTELRVLKGFVTGRSSLNDLKGLKKLRKLSIYSGRQSFPSETDLRALQDLGKHGLLRNLTIAWGAEGVKSKQPPSSLGSFKRKFSKRLTRLRTASSIVVELPEELEKLEIECLPEENLPTWLNPSKLGSLKKFYIRGGKLKDLGNHVWTAEVVRLKYMKDLKMEWGKLQEFFPNLSYFQRVKCPRVTFCPCDENGVWMKPQQ